MAGCKDGMSVASQQKVVLQRPKTDVEPDLSGHVDLSLDANWETVGSVWGSPKTRGGSESYLFRQVQAEVTSIWDLRYSSLTSQIKPTWRIQFRGRTLNLSAVYDVDEARQTIRCECIEAK